MNTENKSHTLVQLLKKCREKNEIVTYNFKKASRDLLNNGIYDGKQMHYFHYYPGRIFPYISFYLLSISPFKNINGTLLDPFAGSGTILLESVINPFAKRDALGVEINPIGRLISKVKTTFINIEEINKLTINLKKMFDSNEGKKYAPNFNNINLWFSQTAKQQLSNLKYAIDKLEVTSEYKDFFWLSFSSIIRKVSKADPYIPPPVVLKLKKYQNTSIKYHKLKKHLEFAENPNVWDIFEETVNNNIQKLGLILKELNSKKAEIIWDDARSIQIGNLTEQGKLYKENSKPLPANSVGLIFTSPPYLTAQKYIRTSRLELLWLGYSEEEVSKIDKISIGTEKINSKIEIKEIGVQSIDKLVFEVFSRSKIRGIMVYEYFKNMSQALKEMYRVLKPGGYAILVMGDNSVLGNKIGTYRLIANEAVTQGFTLIGILKDEIRSRSMITKRNGTGGLIKDEYVIFLKKEG